MTERATTGSETTIKTPPTGLAILAMVGPAFIWAAEFIGSGEVILATRTGAILGTGILWAIVVGIFLKYWIGMSGARYTVTTGEGMIDMISRMPGPKNWAVWIVLVAQFASATISMGAIAAASGIFLHSLIPIPAYLWSWIVALFALGVVWSGSFQPLKYVMSLFVLIIVIGVLYVAVSISPGLAAILQGLQFHIPQVPDWAISSYGVSENPWREILPLMGWAAGGFASQVWYTYWVLGANYGAAQGRGYGRPADLAMLKQLSAASAQKIKGWYRVVYTDATLAMVIGVVVTSSFFLTGAYVLRPNQLAPTGEDVALSLATIFTAQWGALGGGMFMISAAAALVATLIGQLAGWPRLLSDAFRICVPQITQRFAWKMQFRAFLIFFLFTNMIIAFTLGLRPVYLVKMGAVLDGLLLTPLQAVWVAVGLYIVMPKLLSEEAKTILRPHWIFLAGLIVAFLVFGYFVVFQLPYIL